MVGKSSAVSGARVGDLDRATGAVERPQLERAVRSAQSYAGVVAQIVGALGSVAPGEVAGTADDDEAKRRRQSHRDHVGGDELAEPN
jgi:hypothetical protein